MDVRAFLDRTRFRGLPRTSQEDFYTRLKRYDRRQFLWLCAAINFSLHSIVKENHKEVHAAWVRRLFPPDDAEEIIRRDHGVFHRQQLLFLIQEGTKACHEIGEAPGELLPMRDLGELFLMANDRLSPPVVAGPENWPLDLVKLLLTSSESNQLTLAALNMVRANIIITQLLEGRRGEKTFFDIPKLFEGATGISYDIFAALMMIILTRFVNVKDALRDAGEFGIDVAHFRSLSVSVDQLDHFLALVSNTPEELQGLLLAGNPRPNDFRFLKDRPLLRILGRYFPVDCQFGFEKFESAVFWSILKSLSDSVRKTFFSFWGALFEDYVSWLLRKAANPNLNRVFADPRFEDNSNDQVCDVIVQCGRIAVFIEAKGNTFSADAKYGEDTEILRGELGKKLVKGEDSEKGVAQLVATIKSTCAADSARKVGGFDMSMVSTIIPVLITRDAIGDYMGMNCYLNEHFQQAIGRARYTRSICPLVSMNADNLDKLSPYLCDTPLSEILMARVRRDPLLLKPFFDSVGPFLRKRIGADRIPTILRGANLDAAERAAVVLGLKPDKTATASTGAE